MPLGKIQDSEKFLFQVVKQEPSLSLMNRITFQSDDEFENIEQQIANLDKKNEISDASEVKPMLKRKIAIEHSSTSITPEKNIKKEVDRNDLIDQQVITILSDSDNEVNVRPMVSANKKPKLEPVLEEPQKVNCNNKNGINFKTENEFLEYEAFNVKQEYIGYDDDEAIAIDSDSDSESEHWYLRLSQSSPGKPFTILRDKSADTKPEDSSYSQMDDDLGCHAFEDDANNYLDDPVSMPPQHPDEIDEVPDININLKKNTEPFTDAQKHSNNVPISYTEKVKNIQINQLKSPNREQEKDEVDGFYLKEPNLISATVLELDNAITKKAQMIEPLNQLPRRKTNQIAPESKQFLTFIYSFIK